jgi:hypothetical protein
VRDKRRASGLNSVAQGLLALLYPPASSLTLLCRPSQEGDRNASDSNP